MRLFKIFRNINFAALALSTAAFASLPVAIGAAAMAAESSEVGDAPLPMPKSSRNNAASTQTETSQPANGKSVAAATIPSKGDPELSSDRGFSTEDFLPPKKTMAGQKKAVIAAPDQSDLTFVRVQLTVPHSVDAVHKLVAYPYPMALPKARKQISDLPTNTRALKEEILATGYTQRGTQIKPYPFQGWRWQYAYHNALKRAHTDEPAVISDIYPFVDKMLPYCREESKRINAIELERSERYKRLSEEFEGNNQDAETDAVRKGYKPTPVEINKLWRGHFNIGELKLGEGTWYITGTKKVPGITYYWQQPITVVKGQPVLCELTEDNALVIEGGW